MKKVAYAAGLLLALLGPVRAFAEITMFVSPNGDGGYILEGDNAQGVVAIDLSIGYDTASLEDPKVEAQGGTVTDVYEGTPGILNVTVTRENPDASFELHLKFVKKGDLPGVIDYVSATARGKDGRNYAASSDLRALSPPPANEEYDTAPGAPAVKLSGFDEREKSVLQRFKEYRGKKGLKAFAAMFERNGRIVQEPAIAFSDGKTPVVIRLELQPGGNHSPDMALSDAKLVSMQKIGKGWIITLVPREGVWEARLVLGTEKEMIDFPLVIAPPINIADGINENNFLAALDNYLSGQAAFRQRKNEQYLDEYIFTANYLADRTNASPTMTAP